MDTLRFVPMTADDSTFVPELMNLVAALSNPERKDVNVQASHAVGKIHKMTEECIRFQNLQKEVFLSGHIDKIGTHDVYEYPETFTVEDGKESAFGLPLDIIHHERLIVLAPKGIANLPPEEAIAKYPHIYIRWSVVSPGASLSLTHR